MNLELPELPFAKEALEPHMSANTLDFHHGKHHNAYVVKGNELLAAANTTADSLEELVTETAKAGGALFNNVGQHYNHSFFWKVLSPTGGGAPKGELAAAIDAELGGFDAFKDAFAKAGATRFGSGWAWLVVQADGSLAVTSTPNQDSPCMTGVADVEGKPVIALDVWEHAYYLKYQNMRPSYIAAFWDVVDWDAAEANYQKAKA